jgi:malyl-CoA/(S)-citramalyl-CoA lyase
MGKASTGNYFEDFKLHQSIRHATAVTMTDAHVAQFQAFYGPRFAAQVSDEFAKSVGYSAAPLSNMLVFHTVLGKSVPDISLNAVANLGYAEVQWLNDVKRGDTLFTSSQVIGLRENSNGKSGIVYVHTTAKNQHGEMVLSYKRWVMIHKKDTARSTPEPCVPDLPPMVDASKLSISRHLQIPAGSYDPSLSGAPYVWEDYDVGEMLVHSASVQMTSDHMNATRLLGHNTAAVHFDGTKTRTGERLIYGGHVMQHVLSMSYDGLQNVIDVVAINAGSHTAPMGEGDGLRAYSQILEKAVLPGRDDVALLRIRAVGIKTTEGAASDTAPYKIPDPSKPDREIYDPDVVLDLDYWAVVPTSKSLMKEGVPTPANHRLNARPDDPAFQKQPRAERMIHFFPPQIEKMRDKAAAMVAAADIDVLLGNFEDGVPNSEKDAARAGFIDFAEKIEMGEVGLWIRTNQIYQSSGEESEIFIADVKDVVSRVGNKLDVIMVPKVETAADIRHVHKMLTVLEAEHGIQDPIRIHAILETARGIVNVNDIAAASPRMHGMSFGPADYAADMGLKTTVVGGTVVGYETIGPSNEGMADQDRERTQQDVWHYHIAAMVAACRATDIKPMFGPFGAISDGTACQVQFRNAYLMGMEGAWSLHPSQIGIAKSVFSPSPGEVENARKIMSALPEDGSGAAMDEKGNFIDDAVIKQAQVILAVARQVAARDPSLADAYGALGA